MISITNVPFRLLVLFIALAFGVTAGAIPSGKRKDKEKDKSNPPQTQQQTVSDKIDLNTASEKELDSLPGVGPATVKKMACIVLFGSIWNGRYRSGGPACDCTASVSNTSTCFRFTIPIRTHRSTRLSRL